MISINLIFVKTIAILISPLLMIPIRLFVRKYSIFFKSEYLFEVIFVSMAPIIIVEGIKINREIKVQSRKRMINVIKNAEQNPNKTVKFLVVGFDE